MYLIYKLRDFIALLVMAVIGIEINHDILFQSFGYSCMHLRQK